MHQRIMAAKGARSIKKSQENWHRPMSGEKNKTIGGKMPDPRGAILIMSPHPFLIDPDLDFYFLTCFQVLFLIQRKTTVMKYYTKNVDGIQLLDIFELETVGFNVSWVAGSGSSSTTGRRPDPQH